MSNNTRVQVVIARCPDCGERVRLQGRLYIGRPVTCGNCDAELEVIETEPVELDWVDDDDEYDDDEDDDDW